MTESAVHDLVRLAIAYGMSASAGTDKKEQKRTAQALLSGAQLRVSALIDWIESE